MKITHTQREEGGQWEEFDGRTNWTHGDFESRSWPDRAYKFSNGDIWDKVGGWRVPMGWSSDIIVPRIEGVDYNKLGSDLVKNAMEIRDPIFGFLDAGRQKAIHGTIAHYEPPNYKPWQGIRGIDTPYYQPINESLFIDDYEEYKFEFTSNKKENLCSRHLWQ